MESVEPFPDNWAYLRTELGWLDRVLGTAVARQRKEVKDVERVARSQADKATSHWWKGLISVEGEVAGDSPADTARRRSTGKTSYQQQMEARIQVSREKGIQLGLPSLCQKLQLTAFEKNLVLMALAPEISRRYGHLYKYLQDNEQGGGLPTFDLILRLLCRNDQEWRSARLSLSTQAPLVRYGIVLLPPSFTEPFLALPIKLANSVVEYLLADQPQDEQLDCLVQAALNLSWEVESGPSIELSSWQPEQSMISVEDIQPSFLPSLAIPNTVDRWSTLVLPAPLIQALQHLCDRVQYGREVDQDWGFEEAGGSPGSIVLFSGAKGTGKTTAVQAIAQTLQTPLFGIDLTLVPEAESDLLLQDIATQAPVVLLLKSAHVWFGNSASLSTATIQQFLYHRQQQYALTILISSRKDAIALQWRDQFTQMLDFPVPDQSTRLKLWRQAFPAQVPLGKIQWSKLAQIELTGGDIQAIARDAAIMARAGSPQSKVMMKHLLQACKLKELKVDSEQ